MPQPRASSRVQEHPPTRVLGPAGSSVTTQILTGEGGRREVAPPIPRGVRLEATDSPRRNAARMGDADAMAAGVSYLGGERRQRPREISGSGRLPPLLLLLRGQDSVTNPTPHWGHRVPGASPHAQGAKFGAAATTQGLPPPRHRPNRDHE